MFYDRFEELCAEKGVKPTNACIEAGLSRGIAAKWKSTKTEKPSADALEKLSAYFGKTMEEVLNGEPPAQQIVFYDIFSQLCAEKGISCKRAAIEIGLSNSITSKWKNTGATPNGETLQRIADYFGTDVGSLLTGQKNTPADAEEEIKFALFGGEKDITQEMYDDVLRFAQYVKKEKPANTGERKYSDMELLEAFAKADESTKAAIRLLLKVE